jgi:hypothetical protein
VCGRAVSLDDMATILEKHRVLYAPDVNFNSLDLFVDALGRIKATRAAMEEKPDDPANASRVQACSLLVEAAVVQMRIAANRRLLDSLNAKTNAAAEELSAVYDSISDFEQSRASKLKAELVDKQGKLDEERRKAEQLRAEAEKKFSEARAENVMKFLIEQGVTGGRLKAIGYGLTKPIADNSTEEGRRKNRRVDLIIQEESKGKWDRFGIDFCGWESRCGAFMR